MLLGRVVPGQLGGGLAHLLGLALEGRALLLGGLAFGGLLGLEALVGGLEPLDQIPRLDLVLLVRVLLVTGLARPDLNRLVGLEADGDLLAGEHLLLHALVEEHIAGVVAEVDSIDLGALREMNVGLLESSTVLSGELVRREERRRHLDVGVLRVLWHVYHSSFLSIECLRHPILYIIRQVVKGNHTIWVAVALTAPAPVFLFLDFILGVHMRGQRGGCRAGAGRFPMDGDRALMHRARHHAPMRGHLNRLAQDGTAILMRIAIVMRGCLRIVERLGDGDGGVIRVEVGVAFKYHLGIPPSAHPCRQGRRCRRSSLQAWRMPRGPP